MSQQSHEITEYFRWEGIGGGGCFWSDLPLKAQTMIYKAASSWALKTPGTEPFHPPGHSMALPEFIDSHQVPGGMWHPHVVQQVPSGGRKPVFLNYWLSFCPQGWEVLLSIAARAPWGLTPSSCSTTPRPFPQRCSLASPSPGLLSGVNPSPLQQGGRSRFNTCLCLFWLWKINF